MQPRPRALKPSPHEREILLAILDGARMRDLLDHRGWSVADIATTLRRNRLTVDLDDRIIVEPAATIPQRGADRDTASSALARVQRHLLGHAAAPTPASRDQTLTVLRDWMDWLHAAMISARREYRRLEGTRP